jgi:hypothetical protein
MKELNKAYHAARQAADEWRCPSHDHLARVLYDLDCFFSEEGITYDQQKRLKAMGFPEFDSVTFE